MFNVKSILCLILISFGLSACGKTAPKHLQIGTGSRIDILTPQTQFYKGRIPAGWVVEGADADDLFNATDQLPSIYMIQKDGRTGVHIQNTNKDFLLARYTQAKLLVSPYLIWDWFVSEYKAEHHPVRILIGFYGGNPESPKQEKSNLIWTGKGLPPYDRLLAIGFEDMALKRGNLYSMGKVKYYTPRGGFENTNTWHQEAADLNTLYAKSWPNDHIQNVTINFVGISSQSTSKPGGITFSSIRLSR